MNPVIVLCLCIAVPISMGQPLPKDMPEKAAETISLSPVTALKGTEMITELIKLLLNYFSKYISSLIEAGRTVITLVPGANIQQAAGISPESLPAQPNPEMSAACEGDLCTNALLAEENRMTNPTKEQTAVQSPWIASVGNSGSSDKIWIADMFELIRKIYKLPTIYNILETESKPDLVESLKEYMRTVDEGSLAIKYNMADVLEMFTSLVGSPLTKVIN